MATFSFTNNNSGSVYFTYETNRNENGFYDVTSLKAASGSFSSITDLDENTIIQSDYIWSVVLPSGTSSLVFTPAVIVPGGSVNYLITGNSTYTIT